MAIDFDVFISYAQQDLAVVEPLVARLTEDNFSVWIDHEQMSAGEVLMNRIADGILRSGHTIACLTDTYVQRPYTSFELDLSRHRDPDSREARTLPAKLLPMSRDVPPTVAHLLISDLTDELTYHRNYLQLIQNIRRTAPPQDPKDRDSVARACEAPLRYLDDAPVALFQIQRATDALVRYLYRREIGEPPAGLGHDGLLGNLMLSGKLPTDIISWLAMVRTFGNYVTEGHDYRVTITAESIAPALSALRALTAWAFPERVKPDPGADMLASLPKVGDGTERQLPGTPYHLSEPAVGQSTLGSRFAGRDTVTGHPVAIHLVDLPDHAAETFLGDIGRFTGLAVPQVVAPLAADWLVVAGRHRGLYVVLPDVGTVTAQELLEHTLQRLGGRMPPRAAYELVLGAARGLAGLHAAAQVHGGLGLADLAVNGRGVVHVLCAGREAGRARGDPSIRSGADGHPAGEPPPPLTPQTDLAALLTILRQLLAGNAADHEPALRELAGCATAWRFAQILAETSKRLDQPDLQSLNVEYRAGRSTVHAPVGLEGRVELVLAVQVASRRAWPLGGARVLVWEAGGDILAVHEGVERRWRDTRAVAVRLVATDTDDRLAVGGWDGAVRYFQGGHLVATTELDGAVGDLRFTMGGLVAGSWKRSLTRFTADGGWTSLLDVSDGVHRIAVAAGGQRFAVADLAGGLSIYAGDRRVVDRTDLDMVADLGYAAARLIILADEALTSLHLDNRLDPLDPKPGAVRLLPAPTPEFCLLVTADNMRPVELWLIDQAGAHLRYETLPAGARVLSTCGVRGRFAVGLPGGGCAYWSDGRQRQLWPTAVSAALSADGRMLAVSLPDRVELYEEVSG